MDAPSRHSRPSLLPRDAHLGAQPLRPFRFVAAADQRAPHPRRSRDRRNSRSVVLPLDREACRGPILFVRERIDPAFGRVSRTDVCAVSAGARAGQAIRGVTMSKKKAFVEGTHKQWLTFKLCRRACLGCNECGWFWGSEHENETWQGQPATWDSPWNAPRIGRPGDLR